MFQRIKHFHTEEDGAVTVDWVVLCAGIVLIGLAAVNAINSGLGTPVKSTETYLKNDDRLYGER